MAASEPSANRRCVFCDAATASSTAECSACGQEHEPPLPEGEMIGSRYRVIERMGVGPLGASYCVRDLANGADVALKVLADELCPTDEERRALVERMETLAGRTIAGCAMPLEVGADARVAFVTAPLVDGVCLAEIVAARLASQRPLSMEEVLQVLLAASASTLALHSVTAHGALRPENVMITGRGVVLTDCALAAVVTRDRLLTRAARFARASAFMSPEVARGKRVTAVADLFALGAIARELLSLAVDGPPPAAVEVALSALLDPVPARRPGALATFLDALSRACGFDRRPTDAPLAVPETPSGALAPAPGAASSRGLAGSALPVAPSTAHTAASPPTVTVNGPRVAGGASRPASVPAPTPPSRSAASDPRETQPPSSSPPRAAGALPMLRPSGPPPAVRATLPSAASPDATASQGPAPAPAARHSAPPPLPPRGPSNRPTESPDPPDIDPKLLRAALRLDRERRSRSSEVIEILEPDNVDENSK